MVWPKQKRIGREKSETIPRTAIKIDQGVEVHLPVTTKSGVCDRCRSSHDGTCEKSLLIFFIGIEFCSRAIAASSNPFPTCWKLKKKRAKVRCNQINGEITIEWYEAITLRNKLLTEEEETNTRVPH